MRINKRTLTNLDGAVIYSCETAEQERELEARQLERMKAWAESRGIQSLPPR